MLNTAKEFQRRFFCVFLRVPFILEEMLNYVLQYLFKLIHHQIFFQWPDGRRFCLIYTHIKLLDSKLIFVKPVQHARWGYMKGEMFGIRLELTWRHGSRSGGRYSMWWFTWKHNLDSLGNTIVNLITCNMLDTSLSTWKHNYKLGNIIIN